MCTPVDHFIIYVKNIEGMWSSKEAVVGYERWYILK